MKNANFKVRLLLKDCSIAFYLHGINGEYILQEHLNCCKNISYTFFRISYMCRKHVSGTFQKCGPFFYLGVAQLEKLFSYLNENTFDCI